MADFYHIFILTKKDVTYDQLKAKMDLAVDWFKYGTNDWIVYTTSEISIWQERLLPLVRDEGSMFICRLDIQNRNGWMSKRFWDWLAEKGAAKNS